MAISVFVSPAVTIFGYSSFCTFVSVFIGKIPRNGLAGKGEMHIFSFDRFAKLYHFALTPWPRVHVFSHPNQPLICLLLYLQYK